MNIIQLPSILPGDLDLAAINQQLLTGEVQLDWSAVVSAPDHYLAILLADMDISTHADVLDGEDSTMSENIAERVIKLLTKKTKKSPKIITKSISKTSPTVWKQDSFIDTEFVPAQNQANSEQTNLIEPQSKISSKYIPKEPELEPETPKVLEIPSLYQIRNELEQAVLNDLLGPAGGEEEEIDEARVSDRYLVGLLAPQNRRVRPDELEESREQMDDLAISGQSTTEDGTTEANVVPPADKMFPSSLGMTFCVSSIAKALQVSASWGQYERVPSEIAFKEDGTTPKTVWKRQPIRGISPPIVLNPGAIPHWIVHPGYPDVFVSGQIRRQGEDWIVTLSGLTQSH